MPLKFGVQNAQPLPHPLVTSTMPPLLGVMMGGIELTSAGLP